MSGKHVAEPGMAHKLKRKIAGLPIWAWLVGVLGTGIAVAAIVFSLNGVTGTFTFTIDPSVDITYHEVTARNANCTVGTVTTTGFEVSTWPGVGSDAVCELYVAFTNGSNLPVYLADISEASDEFFVNLFANGNTGPYDCTYEIGIGETTYDDTLSTPLLGYGVHIQVGTITDAGTHTVDLTSIQFDFADGPGEGDCDSTT